jgi:hypothetical protein
VSLVYLSVLCVFLCLLVRVTVLDKNNAVVCCLLATSAITLSEKKKRKRKMWSKRWCLKRNIGWVPSDDAIVVSAGKLRNLWDFLSELRSSLFERRLERTVLRPALLPVKTARFNPFFPVRYDVTQQNRPVWECIERFRPRGHHDRPGNFFIFLIKSAIAVQCIPWANVLAKSKL